MNLKTLALITLFCVPTIHAMDSTPNSNFVYGYCHGLIIGAGATCIWNGMQDLFEANKLYTIHRTMPFHDLRPETAEVIDRIQMRGIHNLMIGATALATYTTCQYAKSILNQEQ